MVTVWTLVRGRTVCVCVETALCGFCVAAGLPITARRAGWDGVEGWTGRTGRDGVEGSTVEGLLSKRLETDSIMEDGVADERRTGAGFAVVEVEGRIEVPPETEAEVEPTACS